MSALKNRFKKLGLALGLTAALAAAVAGSVGATAITATQQITGGSLSAAISQDLTFSPITYSHSAQNSTGTMTLNVDDSRGTGAGWSVTVQSGNFVWDGGDSTYDIPASQFSLTAAGTPTQTAGQAIDATNGPLVPSTNSTGSLDTARTVLQASPNYGMGSYSQDLGVALTVPGDSRAGAYSATVTVTTAAAP